jgi:hypothetical protein
MLRRIGLNSSFRHTKPGGWVEFGEFDIDYYSQDGTLAKDSALRRWLECLDLASRNVAERSQAGTSMAKTRLSLAANKRQKKIGAYNLTQLYEGLQGFSLRPFTKYLGWTPEELEVLLVEVRKDLRNRNIHAMFD